MSTRGMSAQGKGSSGKVKEEVTYEKKQKEETPLKEGKQREKPEGKKLGTWGQEVLEFLRHKKGGIKRIRQFNRVARKGKMTGKRDSKLFSYRNSIVGEEAQGSGWGQYDSSD